MDIEAEIADIKNHLSELTQKIEGLEISVAKMVGSQGTVELLLKWVILPLIVILGGLVGIKIVMP